LNAVKRVLGPENESYEPSKGFRGFEPEFVVESGKSEAGGPPMVIEPGCDSKG
jgi:hypothetical protein